MKLKKTKNNDFKQVLKLKCKICVFMLRRLAPLYKKIPETFVPFQKNQ